MTTEHREVGLPIVERLRRQYPVAIPDPDFMEAHGCPTVLTLANPDGPDGADTIEELVGALKVGTYLLNRYRTERPLGNQPHMIAYGAEAAVNVANALLAKLEGDAP